MNSLQKQDSSIWIIDDDQSIRWVLERALTHAGFKVDTFETGSKALVQFKRAGSDARPSLILTDFRMPGINGFELLKQIKPIQPSLPVIIMTAYSDLDTTVDAYQEGAFEYLAKPFDIDDAIALVNKALAKRLRLENDQDDVDIASLQSSAPAITGDWVSGLQCWAKKALADGKIDILTEAVGELEKALMECALERTNGRKQEAAKLLGWGRNTLTRKLKEHY